MLNKIGHYSMNNPASVYDEESLTALELASRAAGKVNEAVEAFNQLEEKTEKAVDYMETNIHEVTEKRVTELVEAGEIVVGMEYKDEALTLKAVRANNISGSKYYADREFLDIL